ncbi:hypothetical protein OJ996_05470 [Luteolibacter sp. GHJ8]|uniref:Uncharacterized protein n=1 Tax=Luteolibacter rhizosphaerae TaxID=2989719 RepID=A0ABT3FZJ2_9BACT|nr:hypothetical protein [Luteolibacter rhizosphaerae]MCW1913009.1 hypothetical protein [Luteolibacter rhizosphaerae]
MAADSEAHWGNASAVAGAINAKAMNSNQKNPSAPNLKLQELVPILGRSWATIEEIASLNRLPQPEVRALLERLDLPVVRLDGKLAFYLGNPARAVRMRSLQGFVPSEELRHLSLSPEAFAP